MNSVPYHFPREPVAPKTGWKIRVSRPFIAPEGKEAVLHALEKNDISSATAPVCINTNNPGSCYHCII